MISFKDNTVRKMILLLKRLDTQEPSGVLANFIRMIEERYEEERMMFKEETDQMVKWAEENVEKNETD